MGVVLLLVSLLRPPFPSLDCLVCFLYDILTVLGVFSMYFF